MLRFYGVLFFFIVATSAEAQCFNNRFGACADPSLLEVRSQISVSIPIAGATASDSTKTLEDARRDLYAMSSRECDTLKSVFSGDCTLSSVNVNSSVQDRGMRDEMAIINMSNTYAIKRAPK